MTTSIYNYPYFKHYLIFQSKKKIKKLIKNVAFPCVSLVYDKL